MDKTSEKVIREFEEDRPMTDPDTGLVLQLRKMLKESLKENAKLREKLREQDPILDKIKTEIKALPRYSSNSNRYLTVYVDVYEVLKIIDKYRGEKDESNN